MSQFEGLWVQEYLRKGFKANEKPLTMTSVPSQRGQLMRSAGNSSKAASCTMQTNREDNLVPGLRSAGNVLATSDHRQNKIKTFQARIQGY